MDCVYQCPRLAIFGYNLKKDWLFLPIEYEASDNDDVYLVDNNGKILGEGIIEKILRKPNKTHIARVKSTTLHGEDLTKARGFVIKSRYPGPFELQPADQAIPSETYVCHCDDVRMEEILEIVGERKFISVDEIKHTTRLGMGACRGKRCIPRLKSKIREYGISVVAKPRPAAPLSNQLTLGELYPRRSRKTLL